MSYCRYSNRSDVYVWEEFARGALGARSFAIFTAGDCWPTVSAHGLTRPLIAAGPMQAITILLKLRSIGLKVPQRAINRLVKEARGK